MYREIGHVNGDDGMMGCLDDVDGMDVTDECTVITYTSVGEVHLRISVMVVH